MLLTEPERDSGYVLLNSRSNFQRRRYSLAHEMGHFLCSWHQQTQSEGFACSKRDMAAPIGTDSHVKQEREANTFAIELLAPKRLLAPFLRRLPDLDVVLALRDRLDISKVAAARRYVSLHNRALAIVVAKDGAFRYSERSGNFSPPLRFEPGEQLPQLPSIEPGHPKSTMIDADNDDWRLAGGSALFVQVLEQEEGYSLVLLQLDDEPEGVLRRQTPDP